MLRLQFASRDGSTVAQGAAAVAAVVAMAGCLGVAAVQRSEAALGSEAGLVGLLGIATLLAVGLCVAARLRVRPRPAAAAVVPVAAIQDLVTWHDRYGDVLRAGPNAQAVIGTSPRDLIGSGLLSRVHVPDRPAFLKALSDAAEGAPAPVVTVRLHAGDGEDGRGRLTWAEIRIQPLPATGREAAGAVAVAFLRDVSVQQRRGEEFEAAQREAERANALKSRFLATVTHELRTPLNAIIGFSELLAADHPFLITDERRKEYAHIIRGSGHHLLSIVNTLLDMSKIESGNFNFEPETFGLDELVGSSCDMIQLKADEAGVRLERRIEPGLPQILADRRACRQILINLISNAVKFTPAGGSVTVSLSSGTDAIALSVADTGIGIPEDDLPRLGDPFFQSGDVHRRSHEGTGLGLSVVRGLVGLHGGEMTIESGPGAGTAVTVVLPHRSDVEPVRAAPVAVSVRPRPPVLPAERMCA